MRKYVFLLLWAYLVSSSVAFADTVVPTNEVTARVVVRAGAHSATAEVGSLRPGERAELLGSVPGWHRVRLASGTEGFVSKRWTKVVSSGPAPAAALPSYTMDVVDVGTGLGILVRGPDFTIVYDAGSNDDEATGDKNRMVAYIKAVAPSITTIDHIILSHPHNDHVSLMADVFKQYQVRQVWDSGALNDMCTYHAFLVAVRDEPGVEYHTAANGPGQHDATFAAHACSETVHLTLGTIISTGEAVPLGQGASMTFLHADGEVHSDKNFNRNSLVVRLDLGGTRVLLMGDAPAGDRQAPSTAPSAGSIEKTLLTCCVADLAAKVLVVGHHGSMTSSRRAFLDAVGASIFIVSAGPKAYGNNNVVLPDQAVIAELNSRHGKILRTDGDGNDDPCKTNPAKIGPDADGKAGGCDNIRVTISPSGEVEGKVWRGSD
jgi:beta-lactamase superfamily II metal-dependent hydrolase